MQRANRLAAALAGLALLGCASDVPVTTSREPYVAGPTCSLASREAWQQFSNDAAAHPEWATTCGDANDCAIVLADFRARVRDEIASVLEHCQSELERYSELAQCTARLRAFIPAWQGQHDDDSYGFAQPNTEYFQAQIAAVPERLMAFPPQLAAALPDLASLEAAAEREGWPYLVHPSALGGARLFILAPDEVAHFERWIVLPIDALQPQVEPGAIASFIGVELGEHPRPHFRDYVVAPGDTGWSASLPSNYAGKCYSCHVSGLRQLLPNATPNTISGVVAGEAELPGATPQSLGRERLASFNARIAGRGVVDWGKSIDLAAVGPPLGRSLGCPDCHNGQIRGALSVLTSQGMLWQKVVAQLAMQRHDATHPVPDTAAMALLHRSESGDVLLGQERVDLERAQQSHQASFDELMPSRSADLQEWLLAEPCQ